MIAGISPSVRRLTSCSPAPNFFSAANLARRRLRAAVFADGRVHKFDASTDLDRSKCPRNLRRMHRHWGDRIASHRPGGSAVPVQINPNRDGNHQKYDPSGVKPFPYRYLSSSELHDGGPRSPTGLARVRLRQEREQLQSPRQASKSCRGAQHRLNMCGAPT